MCNEVEAALLSEIAALRGSDERTGELLAESNHREARAAVRATEAERKLAEAVKVIEFYASSHTWRSSTVYMCGHSGKTRADSDGGQRARTFLSKEAERG